jgi:hypothetical protein
MSMKLLPPPGTARTTSSWPAEPRVHLNFDILGYMQPKMNGLENQQEILTFEAFRGSDKSGLTTYNNFTAFFMKVGPLVDFAYIDSPKMEKFKAEHKDLLDKLQPVLEKYFDTGEGGLMKHTDLFEADLYEAYKIMRGYGYTDEDLFT